MESPLLSTVKDLSVCLVHGDVFIMLTTLFGSINVAYEGFILRFLAHEFIFHESNRMFLRCQEDLRNIMFDS